MGKLGDWAKNKIKEKVHDYQKERQITKSINQTSRARFKEGYEEARVKDAQEGSYKRGQEAYYNRGKAKPQGVTGRVGAVAKGVNSGLQNYGETFLGGGSGKGGLGDFGPGLNIGFGESPKPKNMPPQRITTVSRNGTVRITEQIQPQAHKEESGFGDSGFWMGNEGPRKKSEKHPYDIF